MSATFRNSLLSWQHVLEWINRWPLHVPHATGTGPLADLFWSWPGRTPQETLCNIAIR